jgi:hypothetical protein
MFYDLNLPVSTSTGSAQAAQEQLETRKRVELLVHRMFSSRLARGSWIMGHGNPKKNALLTTRFMAMECTYSRIPGCRIQLRTHREITRQPCKENRGIKFLTVPRFATKREPITPNKVGNVNRSTQYQNSTSQESISSNSQDSLWSWTMSARTTAW